MSLPQKALAAIASCSLSLCSEGSAFPRAGIPFPPKALLRSLREIPRRPWRLGQHSGERLGTERAAGDGSRALRGAETAVPQPRRRRRRPGPPSPSPPAGPPLAANGRHLTAPQGPPSRRAEPSASEGPGRGHGAGQLRDRDTAGPDRDTAGPGRESCGTGTPRGWIGDSCGAAAAPLTWAPPAFPPGPTAPQRFRGSGAPPLGRVNSRPSDPPRVFSSEQVP